MKLPRDITGQQLAKALEKLGYQIDRQTGRWLTDKTFSAGD